MRIFAKTNYNFIRWRWHALILSAVVIGTGLVTLVRGGVPLGIEFTGGTSIVLKFAQPVGEEAVRRAVAPVSGNAVVQQFGPRDANEISIRLPRMTGREEGAALEEDAKQVEAAVQNAGLGAFEVRSRDLIGPVMGRDYQRKGIWATVAALGGILLYIGFRFRFTFALGAIVASLHDILVTLVFLAWFGYDLTLNVVAALLAITGYSVNDTIVVFDRVRENQRQMRREPLDQIVNRSVNDTISRTIITAGTTFLAVLALFLFGGEVLRGFAFTMLVGIITGTYSTIFIAAAIAIILSRRTDAQVQGRTQAQARAKRA